MVKPTEVPVDVLRHTLSDCVRRVAYGNERIVVTFHGKPVCALVPMADLEAQAGKPEGKPAKRRR